MSQGISVRCQPTSRHVRAQPRSAEPPTQPAPNMDVSVSPAGLSGTIQLTYMDSHAYYFKSLSFGVTCAAIAN